MPDSSQLIENILPGFSMISEEEKNLLLNSPEAGRFLAASNAHETETQTGSSFLKYFDLKKLDHLCFQEAINVSLAELSISEPFRSCQLAIIRARLNNEFFWYQFLNQEEIDLLADTPYSREYYYLKNLMAWRNAMAQDQDARIAPIYRKIQEKRNELVLQAKEHLGCILFNSVREDQVNSLIPIVYDPKKNRDEKKTSLRQYSNLANRPAPVWLQSDDVTSVISDALSYIAFHIGITSSMDKMKRYIDRIADAHTFYQFFGLAGEHCGWELDAIDMYNYTRNQENISTIKEVLYALITPQHAFFHEYVQIARYEKNQLNLIIRVLIPLVVIALFLVLTFSLMAPLVISEMLEFLMFFPTLYLATAVASAYVELKNQTYTNLMVWWWGDIYSTPAFHVNPRLLEAFSTPELAQSIADFYTSSLKACDAIEAQYKSKPKGTLSAAEIASRKEIILRKSTLLLEWYDLHSHDDLGYDEMPAIVRHRLHKDRVMTSRELEKDSELYVNCFIDELNERVQPPPPAAQNAEPMRCLFFTRNKETRSMGQRCADHHEKLESIDSIYSRLRLLEASSICV